MFRFFILIFVFLAVNSHAQNLFDKAHSLLFTKYLFNTRQFNMATIELEKLCFAEPKNDSLTFLLLKSYRLSGESAKGIDRANQIFTTENTIPALSSTEYCYLLISQNRLDNALHFVNTNQNLGEVYKLRLDLHINLLQKKWTKANEIYSANENKTVALKSYKPIIDEALTMKRKSPFLAGALSVLIPGLGKVYTSYWKDGALAFLTVGTTTWQSYNGFHRDGSSSFYGWFFGSVATIFYFSTVYGSQKSAKKFNHDKEDEIRRKIDYLLLTD